MRDNAVGKGGMNKPCECLLNIDNTLTPSYIAKISCPISCKDRMSQSRRQNCEAQQVYKEEDLCSFFLSTSPKYILY